MEITTENISRVHSATALGLQFSMIKPKGDEFQSDTVYEIDCLLLFNLAP